MICYLKDSVGYPYQLLTEKNISTLVVLYPGPARINFAKRYNHLLTIQKLSTDTLFQKVISRIYQCVQTKDWPSVGNNVEEIFLEVER